MARIQDKLAVARAKVGVTANGQLQEIEKQRAELQKINTDISSAIEKDSKKPLQLSWLPTKTARVSFFRPLADQKLKGTHTDMTSRSPWGSINVFGPALNIVDEGIFLAVLFSVRKQEQATIKLNFAEICRLLGISVQTKNRKRIKEGIKKLTKTSFDFDLKDGTWTVKHILSDASGNNDMSVVSLDSWLFEHFLKHDITLIDLEFRQQLRGDIAKALYRFLASHRGTQRYYLETLIEALNLDPERELKLNRRAIKAAFGQLRNKRFLSFRYRDDLFFDIEIPGKKQLKK